MSSAKGLEGAGAIPAGLTVCGLSSPQDLTEVAPLFQWKLPPQFAQKAFRVLLGTNANITSEANSRIFDSGWVPSDQPRFEYVVADKNSPQRLGRLRQPYYWSVRIRDAQGVPSDWAPVEHFALRPPMPPRWGLGLVLSAWTRFSTAEQMRSHCEQARNLGIPADAACVDLNWGDHCGLVGGWAPGYSNHVELVNWLHGNGFHLILINHLSFQADSNNPVMVELFRRGFVNQTNGGREVNLHNRPDATRFHLGGRRYAPDFAQPAAREFIKQRILKPYIASGVDAWWNDLPDAYGDWGAAVTTDSDLYLKTMWESLAENTQDGNGRPFMISQPACRLYPAFSPGVPRGYWRGMLTEVVGQVRAAEQDMSGVIHAVNNMMGPAGTEYLARSSAFGLLFPMIWNHNARFPWLWPEELRPIYAKYARLHYRLIPYYYTGFFQNWESGTPLLQSMDSAFPGTSYPADLTAPVCPFDLSLMGPLRLDPEFLAALKLNRDTIRVIDTQYLLGNDLLVVPVYPNPLPEERPDRAVVELESRKPLAGLSTKRRFWLPPGKWADFWSPAVYEGPKAMEVDCPIDFLPIFVRMGAVIPMQPEMDYTDQKPVDPLTLNLYPQGENRYVLYEDDGVTRDYRRGINAQTEIVCAQTSSNVVVTLHPPRGPYAAKFEKRSYVLRVLHRKPTSVSLEGRPQAWSYDGAGGKVVIQVPAIHQPVRIEID